MAELEQPKQTEFLAAYDQYADALFRHAYFRLYDTDRARDLVQEAYCRAWVYCSSPDKQVTHLRALLYRILNNLIVDETRKKRPTSLDALVEQGFAVPDEDHASAETLAAVHEVLDICATLDDKHRQAIIMRYVDGLSPKEISEITGESENVISVRIYRGVRKVRERLMPTDSDSAPNAERK